MSNDTHCRLDIADELSYKMINRLDFTNFCNCVNITESGVPQSQLITISLHNHYCFSDKNSSEVDCYTFYSSARLSVKPTDQGKIILSDKATSLG